MLKAAKPAGTQRIAAVWSSAFTRLGPPEGGTPNGIRFVRNRTRFLLMRLVLGEIFFMWIYPGLSGFKWF